MGTPRVAARLRLQLAPYRQLTLAFSDMHPPRLRQVKTDGAYFACVA